MAVSQEPVRAGHPGRGLLQSLIESGKRCGVEPRAYLGKATPRALRNPVKVTLARGLKLPRY